MPAPGMVAAAAITGLLTGSAHAAEDGFYLGASAGEWTTNFPSGLDVFEERETALKAVIGYRMLDWFALEASYVDFGELRQTQNFADFSDFRLERTGIDAFGVALFDVGSFDLFAKAGLSLGLPWAFR